MHFDFRVRFTPSECIFEHFFQTLDWKSSKFSARAFSARKLRFVFGRGTRRKWVVFYWITLVHFDFRVCFAPSECIFGHFFQTLDVKIPKIFSSRLRRSQTKIRFWSGCAPKMSAFLVGDFGAFWLSCVFHTFWVHIWAFFSDFRSENPQNFQLAPSALANYDSSLVGVRAENEWFFSGWLWRILTFVCVSHLLSAYLGIFSDFRCENPQNFSLAPSALAN